MVLPVSIFTGTSTAIGITQRRRNGKPKNHTEFTVDRCKPDVPNFRVDRGQLRTFAQNNRVCVIRHEQEAHGLFRTNLYISMASSEWMLQHKCQVDVQSCTG